MKWVAGLVVVLALAGTVAFYLYVQRPQQQALEASRLQLASSQRQAAVQKARIADLEALRDRLQRTSSELNQQVAAKESELAALRSTQDELLSGLKQEIADSQIQVERIRDQIRVDMVDEILFDSGEATLKPAGIAVLTKVGTVLGRLKDRPITVQGHTDNVPIKGALTRRFPTNWELSSARATNVARFLQEQAGVDPARLSAAAYAEYRPRASNDTAEGRRSNRRIEVLLGSVMVADASPSTSPSASPSTR